MLGHCKDCKWWGKYGGLSSPRRCDANLNDEETDDQFTLAVEVDDDQGLNININIITGPLAGCSRFEPK